MNASIVFATARLDLIDDLLVAAGWTLEDHWWIPPQRLRSAMPQHIAEGSYDRESAIRLQIQADQAVAATPEARGQQ